MSIAADLLPDADLDERLDRVFGDPADPMPLLERRARAEFPGREVIVWEGDAATFQFTYASPSAERLLGYPLRRWTQEASFWADVVVHPDDRDEAIAYCALATGKNQDHAFAYRAVTATGETLTLHDVVRVVVGRRGVATHLRGVMLTLPADEGGG